MRNFFKDSPYTKDLLSKLADDLCSVKSDIAALVTHTGKSTVPRTVNQFATYSKRRLSPSPTLTDAPLRYLREHPAQSSAGLAGGLLLLGAVGAGIYYLCKSNTKIFPGEAHDHREIDETTAEANIPDLTP